MMHRYSYILDEDGDYVVLESLSWKTGGEWIEHTRWLVPGSFIDE